MVQNPPAGTQRIVPYLYYADAAAALAFVCEAFQLEERFAMKGPDGAVAHAEAALHDAVVMLGRPPHAANLGDLAVRHGSVLCYVDDVDAHYRHAKATGATILTEPEDKPYGDRMYSAVDPEGHEWFFATHVRDVAPEDMGG